MKKKLMAMLLLAGGSAFAGTHFSVGVNFGVPGYYAPAPVIVAPAPVVVAPAPVVVAPIAYRPVCPGPGYVWIDGYRNGYGQFVAGYWALPPYAGAYWVAPRYTGGRFYAGYWGGARYYSRPGYRR